MFNPVLNFNNNSSIFIVQLARDIRHSVFNSTTGCIHPKKALLFSCNYQKMPGVKMINQWQRLTCFITGAFQGARFARFSIKRDIASKIPELFNHRLN